jgi:hypothetical protein
VLARLTPLAVQFTDVKRRHDEALAGIAAPGMSDEYARRLVADEAEHEARLGKLHESERAAVGELQTAQKRIADLDAQVAAQQRADAQRGWLAKLFTGSSAARVQAIQTELESQRLAEARAKKRAEEIAVERQQAAGRWHTERERRVSAEASDRRADFERRRVELSAAMTAAEPEVRRTSAELWVPLADPFDPAIVARAAEELARVIEQTEPEIAEARSRAEYLTEHAEEIPGQWLRRVNLAAAPVSALGDESLAELSRERPFDLLILDEAERFSEATLLAAARRATRWVLVGEPADERPEPNRKGRAGPWQRLWHQLHAECWRVEAGRVCCQLRPLSDGQRRELETERVADSPDCELRIWAPAHAEPTLAEVLFPAGNTVEQALEYLFRELNEIPGPIAALCWSESREKITCRLFDALVERTATLGLGLSAKLQDHCGTPRLAAIEFAVTAGWDRERAAAWVRQSLRFSDTGRTARLHAQHRMRPAVAAFACALGFDGVCPSARPNAPAIIPAVEFIPVPALANEPLARRRGDVGLNGQQRRLPPLRGGAGFDIDLSDPRQRDRLPADLLPILPPRGFVNLPEAEAIVRLVDNLIADLPGSPADRPASIAVLALFEAQAALIRHLLNTVCPVPLHIASATEFRQCEADLVVISLTRSHGHRAVTYGDELTSFPIAVTRARQRLVLVGDPGTLSRRTHWDGPLDHLHADAARCERDWVEAFVRLLQGSGPATVHLREGPP